MIDPLPRQGSLTTSRTLRRSLFASAWFITLGVLVVGALHLTACKQDEGDRCQTTADCIEGLVCNQATQQCAKTTGGGIDATVPDIADAPPDTPPDTPPDVP